MPTILSEDKLSTAELEQHFRCYAVCSPKRKIFPRTETIVEVLEQRW